MKLKPFKSMDIRDFRDFMNESASNIPFIFTTENYINDGEVAIIFKYDDDKLNGYVFDSSLEKNNSIFFYLPCQSGIPGRPSVKSWIDRYFYAFGYRIIVNKMTRVEKTLNNDVLRIKIDFNGHHEEVVYSLKSDSKQEPPIMSSSSFDLERYTSVRLLYLPEASRDLGTSDLFSGKFIKKYFNRRKPKDFISSRFSDELKMYLKNDIRKSDSFTEFDEFLDNYPYCLLVQNWGDRQTCISLLRLYNESAAPITAKAEAWSGEVCAHFIYDKIIEKFGQERARDLLLEMLDEFFDLDRFYDHSDRLLSFFSDKLGVDLQKTFSTTNNIVKVKTLDELKKNLVYPSKVKVSKALFAQYPQFTDETKLAFLKLRHDNPEVFSSYYRICKYNIDNYDNCSPELFAETEAALNDIWCSLDGIDDALDNKLRSKIHDMFWQHIGSVERIELYRKCCSRYWEKVLVTGEEDDSKVGERCHQEVVAELGIDASDKNSVTQDKFADSISWVSSLRRDYLAKNYPEIAKFIDDDLAKINNFFSKHKLEDYHTEHAVRDFNHDYSVFTLQELVWPFSCEANMEYINSLPADADVTKYPPILLSYFHCARCDNKELVIKGIEQCFTSDDYSEAMIRILNDFARGARGGFEADALRIITRHIDKISSHREPWFNRIDYIKNLAQTVSTTEELPALRELINVIVENEREYETDITIARTERWADRTMALAEASLRNYQVRHDELYKNLPKILDV